MKKRAVNNKELNRYYNKTWSNAQKVMAQQIDEEMNKSNPFEHAEVDKTVDQIVEDLQPQIFDTIFQMINDEMAKRYVFDSSEYLTEAGLELFEDEWFEFYHENHGRIMHKLIQNLK